MPHWKSMMTLEYLYAFDLKGKDVTLTIERVTAGELKGTDGKKSKKPLVYFAEGKDKRPLAFNSTNCKITAALYGNDTAGWIGKRITIYPTTCEAFGQTVDCVRVRPKIPTGAPEPSDNDGGSPA